MRKATERKQKKREKQKANKKRTTNRSLRPELKDR